MAYWSSSSGPTQQLIKGGRGMVAMSDDNIMMKQIIATHTPDGREVDVKPLFFLVQDILNRATFQVETPEVQMEIEDKTQQAGLIAMVDAISYTIDRISCEIAYKALGGSDAHATTVSLFNLLATYSWDAKLVLTLAAFALNYGEFWLLAQIYSTNQLAKSMAILKQLPSIMEHTGQLKSRFDALNNLIKAMMDVTKCVIQFKELPSAYIQPDVAAFSTAMAHIPIAVYWTIRSVVACATQITMLTSLGHEVAVSTTEAWELSTLAHKLKTIYEHLTKQLVTCYQYIDEKRSLEAFQMLLHLFETIHVDNMKILRALIYAKDDLLPLVDGASKKRVSIDVLRRRNVLLLISSLDFSHEELSILEQIYLESRQQAGRLESHSEVVWIPIVDESVKWNETMQKQFEALQASMPWYTVHHPSLIEKAVIKFIKEVWHFKNRPILVVLDPQGKVVSPNAIHMMWIWGINAFPFTSTREEALWKEEIWRLELLVDGIDLEILGWIREGKYIFLYGGDDLEWIRKFTKAARSVATAASIPLEMVYVGKSTKREQVRRITASIQVEKLSHFWQDHTMVWFFWTRLESMLFSKIQLGKADSLDPMMQEIKKLLSYDRDGGWAVLSKGSQVIVNGHGTIILPTLLEYDIWKEHIPVKGFDVSFKEHHQKLHGVGHPCCRFEFSSHFGRTPHSMTCPECQRVMEKFTTFGCCHDDQVPGSFSSSLR
ncbi:protein SIEVE ELEMENT OCCLUSION B isoform X2 [Mangifera indica]|uniref:protein SIEVE ELEMENT OCCLUSION B isoform X2 n=1 Tax=Mangifera indica TaxID=29780 RepID=UPI001CFC1CBA|nr:protein SIEVE ELEMENT OCCLUSION B isoform X2 [Mangifera indica]